MLSDSLTKDCVPTYLRHIMSTGLWSILEEGVALQRKLIERSRDDDQKKVGCV